MINSIEELQKKCATCPVPPDIKDELCYICATENILEGKWKVMILWLLKDGAKRFSQLLREIPQVKQGPLTTQLKALAKSGLVLRTSYNQVPPKVEYSLTDKGREFIQVLNYMELWAKEHLFPFES